MADLGRTDTSSRWVIWQSKLDASALVEYRGATVPRGDDRALFERVEVMPVAEHERLMANRCGCRSRCGDVPEDAPGQEFAVCKGLPR